MNERELLSALSVMIETGQRYLKGQGWLPWQDGVSAVPPTAHGEVANPVDVRFRDLIGGLEDLRYKLTEGEPPF